MVIASAGSFVCIIPLLGALAYTWAAALLAFGFNFLTYNCFFKKQSLSDLFAGFTGKNIGRWTQFLLWFMLIVGGCVVVLSILMLIPFVGPILYIIGYIPYIILCFGICMSTYILFEEPEMKTIDIMKKSWNMMNGHKWRYFWLSLAIQWLPLIFIVVGYGLIIGGTFAINYSNLVLTLVLMIPGIILTLVGIVWDIAIFARIALLPVVFYDAIKGEKTPAIEEAPAVETPAEETPIVE